MVDTLRKERDAYHRTLKSGAVDSCTTHVACSCFLAERAKQIKTCEALAGDIARLATRASNAEAALKEAAVSSLEWNDKVEDLEGEVWWLKNEVWRLSELSRN